jgi:hypothetical protein
MCTIHTKVGRARLVELWKTMRCKALICW